MRFEVWAPGAAKVTLQLAGTARERAPGDGAHDRTHAMERDPRRPGWWTAEADAAHGARYGFRLDDGPVRPDPRSRRQPDGPDGLSAVVDHGHHPWRVPWAGRGLPGAVLYELHAGTFTAQGTLGAAARRLGHVAGLGATHVELMPVCPFPGRHGWGYDGVAPWAVHEPYGGPEALKRFVDTAHGHGLGVVLDVVHNHFGPSGNHLTAFGPYLTDTHHTPWGAAVNLDAAGSDDVRAYLVGSALAWLGDYRLDGLRLDAVHALRDTRALGFLEELSEAVDGLAERSGRPLFLIAESDLNDPRVIGPRAKGGLGVHAQWSDDFHHALHCALTGETHGYYADFGRAPLAALARTLTHGFFLDGRYSGFRGRRHGRPLDRTRTAAHRLIGYAQNHDQVGNRALGDRLAAALSPGLLACAAALTLTAPHTPMLFMGEEWGATTPWQFFSDHTDPRLAAAVAEGRRREFAADGRRVAGNAAADGVAGPGGAPAPDVIPDPQDPATRDRSCLDWSQPHREPGARLLAWHRELIALRHAEPDLLDPDFTAVRVAYDEQARWCAVRRGDLLTAVNLAPTPVAVPVGRGTWTVCAAWQPKGTVPPGTDGLLHLPGESCAVVASTRRA